MSLRRFLRRHAHLLALTTCAAVTGLAVGSAVANADPGKANSDQLQPLFTAHGLMPGQSMTAHFSVPAPKYVVPALLQPIAPYLQAVDVHDGCTTQGCTSDGPKLSQRLRLRVAAADGTTATWTPAQLTSRQILPGALASGGDGTTYAVTMQLPVRDGNEYADRTVSMDFRWGLMDRSGNPLPRVLGEGFRRTPSTGAGLPFTGADIVEEILVAVCLLAAGTILLAAGRRRRAK